jgi:hypothetical protein
MALRASATRVSLSFSCSDGPTITGHDSAVYRQRAPSGSSRDLEAIVDDNGTPHSIALHCTEEVPMGGACIWPSSLLKSGARQLEPGPDHVIGKLAGTGLSASTTNYSGGFDPGTGTLNLHYHDLASDTVKPWTIGGVQQTVTVYQWGRVPIANTDMYVIAHRDRWLRWWVMPAPAAATITLAGTDNGGFTATPLSAYGQWKGSTIIQGGARVPLTGIAVGTYVTGEFAQLNPTGGDTDYQITADWSGGRMTLDSGTTYPEFYTIFVDWQSKPSGGAWSSIFGGYSSVRRYYPFANSHDATGQSQTIVKTLGHTFFRCVLTLTKASSTGNTLYWNGGDWIGRLTLQVIPK